MLVRVGLALSVSLLLTACSYNTTISEHAVKYNETVANADNANMLLNILRARDRHPMHFTAISQVRGSLSLESTGGLSVALPWDLLASSVTFTPSVSITQTTSPSFDVAVLDSKDFMSGILSPVKLETMKYYFDEQWSRGLVLHLFVHKVTVSKAFLESDDFCASLKDGAIRRELLKYVERTGVGEGGKVAFNNSPPVVNNPEDPHYQAFKQFLNLARCMSDEMRSGRVRLESVTSAKPVGPKFELDKKNLLSHIMNADDKNLRLAEVPGSKGAYYQLCKPQTSYVFCFGKCAPAASESGCETSGVDAKPSGSPAPPSAAGKSATRHTTSRGLSIRTNNSKERSAAEAADGYESEVYIRSVQNMIYHLGEILRYQEQFNDFIEVDEARLFHLTTDAGEADQPPISVTYNGRTYYVPRGGGSWTKDALAMLIQLMGLYKEASDLPTTSAVQAVGN